MNQVHFRNGIIYKDYYSLEAFRTLRTNIEFAGEHNRVIAVTSSIPHEGKSTVAINLAHSLADAGYRVLFIDTDMRNSVITGKLEFSGELKGLSHFLSGQSQLKEVMVRTDMPNLQIIAAGPVPPNPAELLGYGRFKALIQQGRKIYDYIILDTPPLGLVIDAAIVAQLARSAILVVESGVTGLKQVEMSKEQLEKAGCNVLGVILNKTEKRRRHYYGKNKKDDKYGKYGSIYGKESDISFSNEYERVRSKTENVDFPEDDDIDEESRSSQPTAAVSTSAAATASTKTAATVDTRAAESADTKTTEPENQNIAEAETPIETGAAVMADNENNAKTTPSVKNEDVDTGETVNQSNE